MHTVTLNSSVAQLHDQHQIQQQHQERHLETQSSLADQDEEMVNLSSIGDLAQVMPEDIVSIPKEMILISLVSQEQALFNPKHEHYRSTQRKDAKWMEIADHVGWQETQCKSKWKALRDQYCRELKRSKQNANTNVKWKYFKVLDFLRPYALARHYRSRSFNSTNPTATSIVMTPTTSLGNNSYSTNNNSSSSNNNNNNNNHSNASVLSTSIKIEANMLNCNFPSGVSTTGSSTPLDDGQGVQIKNESVRLMPTLTAEQINSVIQQQDGNWNYLTATNANGSTTMAASRNDQPEGSNNIAADDALYNALVDCVTAATSVQMQSQQQHHHQQHHNQHQQLHSHTQNTEEEDEDPIHTFLNIESYFEKELISLIHQEDILYNNSNQNYRNVKMKLEIWDEIARKLKKSVKQCRQKWKALRDQFIREHKRLKTRDNLESMPRWKHYDALSFLQKFIKHKTNGNEAQQIILLPKIETDTDMDDQINMNNNTSPLRSPHVQQQQLGVTTLPTLTGPQLQQTTQNQTNNLETTNNQQLPTLEHHHDNNNATEGLCVTANYDEMDIENYINGDGGTHEPNNDDEDMEECDDDQQHHVDLKPKAVQQQQQYSDYNINASSRDEDREFLSLKMVTVSGQNTMTSSNINQTLHMANNHHHSITLEDTNTMQQHQTPQQQQQQHDEFQQPQTPSSSASLSLQTTPNSNNATQTTVQQQQQQQQHPQQHHHGNTGAGAAAATSTTQQHSPTKSEDDEIGAFFKAIAMKIRTANLPPVAFTDLQIDILRVINESLRHH